MSNNKQQELLIVQHETVLLPINELHAHPLNRPATGVKQEQIDALKTLISQNGYNSSKPITVRKMDNGYQIIEGHHRWVAAKELGYTELPCAIENLNDVETNLRLLIGNQQEGNDPLDIGLNAIETTCKGKHGSDLSISAFAGRLGKSQPYITQVYKAATVYREIISQLINFDGTGKTQHLFEISAAPRHAHTILASLLVEFTWSVKDTKAAVDRVNAVLTAMPHWLVGIHVDLKKVAMEPGYAKATASAFSITGQLNDRLEKRVTLYRLEATTDTKQIDGREYCRHAAVGYNYLARNEFQNGIRSLDDLNVQSAEKLYHQISIYIDQNTHAKEEWKPVLTDEEERARAIRAAELARMTDREAFTPRMLHGDVFDKLRLLPSDTFDLVCIDPPYNMDKADWDSLGSGKDFATWASPWLKECQRVLKASGAIYVFGINRMLSHLQHEMDSAGLVYRNWITWDTIQGAGGGLWVNRTEAILYYGKTAETFEDADSVKLERHEENVREYRGREYAFKNPSNIWRFPCVDDKHSERTDHPTQKPVELIERIVLASSPREGRVLDCFMGSGTTGVAAMKNRRYCTGIDQSEQYIAIAQSRFATTEVPAA